MTITYTVTAPKTYQAPKSDTTFMGFNDAWTPNETGKKTYSQTTNAITHAIYSMFGASPTEEQIKIRDKAIHVNYALASFAGGNNTSYFLDRFGRLERLTTGEGKFVTVTQKTAKETRSINSIYHAEDLASELLAIVLDEDADDMRKAWNEYDTLQAKMEAEELNQMQEERFSSLVQKHDGDMQAIVTDINFRRCLRRIWRYIRKDYEDSVKFSRFSEFETEDDNTSVLDIISGLVEKDNTSPEEDVLLLASAEMMEDRSIRALARLTGKEKAITSPAQRAVRLTRELETAQEAYQAHLARIESGHWSLDIARKESQLLQAGIQRIRDRLKDVIQELYTLQCSALRRSEAMSKGMEFSTILEQVKNRRELIRKYEAIAYN